MFDVWLNIWGHAIAESRYRRLISREAQVLKLSSTELNSIRNYSDQIELIFLGKKLHFQKFGTVLSLREGLIFAFWVVQPR